MVKRGVCRKRQFFLYCLGVSCEEQNLISVGLPFFFFFSLHCAVICIYRTFCSNVTETLRGSSWVIISFWKMKIQRPLTRQAWLSHQPLLRDVYICGCSAERCWSLVISISIFSVVILSTNRCPTLISCFWRGYVRSYAHHLSSLASCARLQVFLLTCLRVLSGWLTGLRLKLAAVAA